MSTSSLVVIADTHKSLKDYYQDFMEQKISENWICASRND